MNDEELNGNMVALARAINNLNDGLDVLAAIPVLAAFAEQQIKDARHEIQNALLAAGGWRRVAELKREAKKDQ